MTDRAPSRPPPAHPVADRLARVVTEAFAPAVLLTVLPVVVGWHAYGNSLAGVAWGFLASIFASIIPFAVILRGVRGGTLTDHHVGRREQRRTPLLAGLGSVVAGLIILTVLGAARELVAVLATVAIVATVSVAVSHWWKMSLHTAGAGAFIVVLTEIYGPAALVLSPLLVIVGWSRVRLRDHTPAQVVVGGVVGVLVGGVAFATLR